MFWQAAQLAPRDVKRRGARMTSHDSRGHWRVAIVGGLLVGLVVVALVARHDSGDAIAPPPRDTSDLPAEGHVGPILTGRETPVQDRSPPPAAQPTELTGAVVSRETFSPIPGALLYALNATASDRVSDGPFVVTSGDGRFSLPLPVAADGRLRVHVRAEGFVPEVVLLKLSASTKPTQIELGRGLSIGGHVRDAAGRPLAGVKVHALGVGAEGKARLPGHFRIDTDSPPNLSVASTNDAGEFLLGGLTQGRIRLRASRRGWRMAALASPPARSARDEPMPLGRPTTPIVEVGTQNVDLRMVPVWALNYVAVDAATGEPLKYYMVRYSPTSDKKPRWALSDGEDEDWFSGSDPHFRAKRAYFVRDDQAQVPMETLSVRVDAPGYERAEVVLTPRHPDDPEYLVPEQVRLQAQSESGVLRVRFLFNDEIVREPVVVQVVEHGRRVWVDATLVDQHPDGGHLLTLPAGQYRLALQGVPSFRTLDAVPIDVTVRAGEVTEVSSPLAAGLVVLRVSGGDGRPLDGAVVRVTYNDAFARSWLVQKPDGAWLTDATLGMTFGAQAPGVFRMFLRPGSYKVQIASWGYQDVAVENMVVEANRQTTLPVTLAREE